MFQLFSRSVPSMIPPDRALVGRAEPMVFDDACFLTGRSLSQVPAGFQVALFGMGCFWGAERRFWTRVNGEWTLRDGVWTTAVGYAGGYTPNPTYREVCSGQTGHTEVVRVVFDPAVLRYEDLLKIFWEGHDPTQPMRQGNDVGTQYRTWIGATSTAQHQAAEASRTLYQSRLTEAAKAAITTEVVNAGPFYFAESYHQQYLAKNPDGYCGLGGTGVSCPI